MKRGDGQVVFQDGEKRRADDSLKKFPALDRPEVLVETPPHVAKQFVLAAEVSKPLYRVRGFWPFDFYPDELIIEDKRIVIKERLFPFGTTINTIPLEDLGVFELMQSIFFSAIHIQGGKMSPVIRTTIKWLFPREAQRAKDIVDGLLLRESESLDINQFDRRSIVNTLQALGKS